MGKNSQTEIIDAAQQLAKATKNKNAKIVIIAVAAVIVIAMYFFGDKIAEQTGYVPQVSDNTMTACFIDVGQGDSALFVNGDYSVLIDAGERVQSDNVVDHLKTYGIKKLSCVIATHPHSDHIGGMEKVINEIGAEKVIIPEVDSANVTSSYYFDFLKAVRKCGSEVYYADPGDEYTFGDMTFTVLAPFNKSDDLNDNSIVTYLTYSTTSFLLMGDAGKDIENQIMKTYPDLSCDIIKIGHHGSKTSTSDRFIKTVDPDVAVISVGKNNDYGHPKQDVLDILNKYKLNVIRTDEYGDIKIVCEKNNYNIDIGGLR